MDLVSHFVHSKSVGLIHLFYQWFLSHTNNWRNYIVLSHLVRRVFINSLGDLGSIPGRVIPKTLKMVLDTSLLNTQQYKVCMKGKVEQSRGKEWRPPLHLGVVAIEKGAFWSPLITVTNYSCLIIIIITTQFGRPVEYTKCISAES